MILSRPNIWHSMQKQTQKRLKSGFKIISWTVSTLEGGGSIMLPALYTLSSLRFWLARNARAYTSARSIGFCVIWVCISSSSSSTITITYYLRLESTKKYIWLGAARLSGLLHWLTPALVPHNEELSCHQKYGSKWRQQEPNNSPRRLRDVDHS